MLEQKYFWIKFLIIKAKYKVAASVDISISFYVLLNNILAII